MVIDFTQLKSAMTDVIDQFDHALVLEVGDPLLAIGDILQDACIEKRLVITPYRPTAENMAEAVARTIKSRLGYATTVKLWETASSCAEYSC
jgi:6-pyruvoyltetrahydropterin/6-carboxytetrahydropterin synthase